MSEEIEFDTPNQKLSDQPVFEGAIPGEALIPALTADGPVALRLSNFQQSNIGGGGDGNSGGGNSAYWAEQSRLFSVSSRTSAASLLPWDFQQDGKFWTHVFDGPAEDLEIGWDFPTVVSLGKVAQKTIEFTDDGNLGTFGRIAVIPSRDYKIKVKFRYTELLGAATTRTTLFAIGSGSDYGYLTDLNVQSIDLGVVDGWQELLLEFNSDQLITLDPNIAFIQPMIRNEADFNGGDRLTFQIAYVKIEDVTESLTANLWAEASAQFAINAATSANASGVYANASILAATQANTSAAAANTFAFQASESATEADNARAAAVIAQGVAANAAIIANTYANAAANSALSAEASANSSGQFASAAANSAISAGVAANNASANAASAQSSAVAANNSAASANASSVLSATYTTAARTAATATFPTTFENIESGNPVFFAGDGGGPTPVRMVPGSAGSYGPYLETTVSGSYSVVTRLGRSPSTNGKRWKVRALVSHVSGTPTTAALRVEHWSAATGGTLDGTQTQNTAVISSSSPVWVEYTFTTSSSSGFIKPSFIGNYPSSSATQRIYALEMIDVEQVELATAQAVIANNAATSANSSAASANASSVLSAAYTTANRLETASNLPETFDNDGAYFFAGYSGAPTSLSTLTLSGIGSFPVVSGIGKVAQLNLGGTYDISNIGAMPIRPGRTYRATVRCRTLSSTRTGTVYLITLDSSYTYVAIGGASLSFTATTAWQEFSWTMSGDTIIAGGGVYGRTLARVDAGGAGLQWSTIRFEDITESTVANSYATIANNAAVSANSSAASAQTNALLSASLGKGYLNPYPNFASWTSASVAPSGWSIWGGGAMGGGVNQRYNMVELGYNSNQRPENSDWGYGANPATSGVDAGLQSEYDTPIAPGSPKIIVEASARLYSGTWHGAGILVYYFNASGTYIGANYIPFWTEPDTTGTAGSSALGLRKWSVKFTPTVGTYFVRLYCMGNWAGFPTGAVAAKSIAFLNAGFKSQDAVGAQVETQASAIVTLESKTAAWMTRVSAGSGTAVIALNALDSGNSSPASSISLLANEVRLGNTSSNVSALTIANGNALFSGELNVGTGSGARVNITKNLIRVYDANNVMRVRLGVW